MRLIYSNGVVSQHHKSDGVWLAEDLLFRGRAFIRDLVQVQPQWGAFSERVGDVFWFDQNRNLTSVGNHEQHGLERLRESLVGWWGVHTSQRRNGTPDYLDRRSWPH